MRQNYCSHLQGLMGRSEVGRSPCLACFSEPVMDGSGVPHAPRSARISEPVMGGYASHYCVALRFPRGHFVGVRQILHTTARGALVVIISAAPPLRQKSFCKIFLASAVVGLIALPVVNARASCTARISKG